MKKITNTSIAPINLLIKDNTTVHLACGSFCFAEDPINSRQIRIYSKKKLIELRDEAKPDHLDLYRAYNSIDINPREIVENLIVEETILTPETQTDVKFFEIDVSDVSRETLEQYFKELDEVEKETTKIEGNTLIIIDSEEDQTILEKAKKDTNTYQEEKPKPKSRRKKGPGRPKKRGPKKGSKRKPVEKK